MAEDQVNIGIGDQLVGSDGAGIAGFPLHGGQRDDLDVRERRHLLLKPLLDVEGVGIARIAEDLQHFSLHRTVLGGEEFLRLLGRDVADLDGAGDRGEGRRRRGDLAVEFDHGNAGGHGGFDAGLKGVEIDRSKDDRGGLQRDHVVHLALLRVGLVVGIERDQLITDLLQEGLEGRDRAGLELIEQGGHEIVNLALGLGEGRRQQGQRRCHDAQDGEK